MRNRLLSFEGNDGCGKTSQLNGIVEWLRNRGETVVVTREPGGTPLGEKLRAILLNDYMDSDTELMLMFAARRQHLTEVIEPALKRGEWVVTDRFECSTYAFQGARGIDSSRIAMLDQWCGGIRPGLTLFFDVPVEIAFARRAGREAEDRFEAEATSYHQRVRDIYLARVAENPLRMRTINANQSIEDVRRDVIRTIEAAYFN